MYVFAYPAADPRNQVGLQDRIHALKRRAGNVRELLEIVVDEIVLPALERNYDASGLKTRTGVLKRGIRQRGALGNYVHMEGDTITVGVSYEQIPYARWALEGRGPVQAIRAKALRFYDENGKPVFRKRVGPAPPHQVYFLNPADIERAEQLLGARLVKE